MNPEHLPTSSAPLQLDAGESSDFLRFETSGSDRMMLLRVVVFGSDGARGAKPPPLIRLRADTGPAVAVTEFPNAQPIVGAENHIVGSATWMRKNFDVYLVQVSLDRPGSSWHIQIMNDDSDAHTFQVVSFGGTRIHDEDGWPGSDLVYCGAFPCACTRHEGSLTTKCPHCGHKALAA
jgi:hypothetical protein